MVDFSNPEDLPMLRFAKQVKVGDLLIEDPFMEYPQEICLIVAKEQGSISSRYDRVDVLICWNLTERCRREIWPDEFENFHIIKLKRR